MTNVTYMGFNNDTYKSMVIFFKEVKGEKDGMKVKNLIPFGKKICYNKQDEMEVVENCELKKGFYYDVDAYSVIQKESIEKERARLGI